MRERLKAMVDSKGQLSSIAEYRGYSDNGGGVESLTYGTFYTGIGNSRDEAIEIALHSWRLAQPADES